MSLYSNYKKSMKNLNFQLNKYTIAVKLYDRNIN